MGFCICLAHAGFIPAVLSFILWSLPGAVGMFLLAWGISRIGTILPSSVYALLSGLNAATVGIIALAAVQLSTRAITDDVTRAILIVAACAGMCYNALWYFPTLMAAAGIVTVAWDVWGVHRAVVQARRRWKDWRMRKTARRNELDEEREPELENSSQTGRTNDIQMTDMSRKPSLPEMPLPAAVTTSSRRSARSSVAEPQHQRPDETPSSPRVPERPQAIPIRSIGIKTGLAIIIGFFISFITIMVLRSTLDHKPVELSLFSNLYLAGALII